MTSSPSARRGRRGSRRELRVSSTLAHRPVVAWLLRRGLRPRVLRRRARRARRRTRRYARRRRGAPALRRRGRGARRSCSSTASRRRSRRGAASCRSSRRRTACSPSTSRASAGRAARGGLLAAGRRRSSCSALIDQRGIERAAVVGALVGLVGRARRWRSPRPSASQHRALRRVGLRGAAADDLPLGARASGVGETLFALYYTERPDEQMALAFYDKKYVTESSSTRSSGARRPGHRRRRRSRRCAGSATPRSQKRYRENRSSRRCSSGGARTR